MPRALLVLCCTAVCSVSLAVPVAAAGAPPTYRPPVDAPVLDPFRAPTTRFGAGNRGLEYATPPGTPVGSAADGTVTFAGPVAGSLHVTVLHDDGVRTTYSFLEQVLVVVGQRVRRGDLVGRTAGALHLGARRGADYFDPASLFESGPVRVRLVPFDEPPGDGPAGERRAIDQLVGGLGRVLASTEGAAEGMAGWLRDGGSQLLRTVTHYASRFTYPTALIDATFTGWRAWQRARRASERACSAPEVQPSPSAERRIAVLVAGLGSQSRSSTVDQIHTGGLGYESPDVLRFSYAGGRVPDPTDGFGAIPASDYDAPDTQADLRATAGALADLVEAVVAEAPGVPIDLLAHSQGGVVTRLALIELEQRHGVAWLGQIGMVATLGTPHGGADAATAIHAVSSTRSGQLLLDAFSERTGQELDHDGTSVAQLSETSDVVAELVEHPVPAAIDAVSIAARGDLIVPVPRSVAPGMDEVVVPLGGRSAHSDLPGSQRAHRELTLALAGLPPGCQTFQEALLDQGMGEGISLVEDWLGAASILAATSLDVRVA